jgi:hypothetical protein
MKKHLIEQWNLTTEPLKTDGNLITLKNSRVEDNTFEKWVNKLELMIIWVVFLIFLESESKMK